MDLRDFRENKHRIRPSKSFTMTPEDAKWVERESKSRRITQSELLAEVITFFRSSADPYSNREGEDSNVTPSSP